MTSLLTSLTSFVTGPPKQDESKLIAREAVSKDVATTTQEASAQKSQQAIQAEPQLPKATPPAANANVATQPSTAAPALSTEQPKAQEERVQTLGLEDPSDPRTLDDPAIFNNKERIPLPPPGSEPVKTLVDSQGQPYVDPKVYGGSMLDKVGNGFGEPLNVISESLDWNESGVRTTLMDWKWIGASGSKARFV